MKSRSARRAGRSILLALILVACGSSPPSGKQKNGKQQTDKFSGPQTAREKQLAEFKEEEGATEPKGAKWGGWKYQGDRDDCFYVVGRRCFATEKAACKAATCKKGTGCSVEGAGPATVSCSAL